MGWGAEGGAPFRQGDDGLGRFLMRPGHQSDFPRTHQGHDPLRGLTQDLLLRLSLSSSPHAAADLHTAAEENQPLDFQPSMTGHVSHHHQD